MNTYHEAIEKLNGRDRRKIDNNTYLEKRNDGAIAVKLHATDVVTFLPDGTVKLDSGGWRTNTTKDRINNYSPVGISQKKGIWYVLDGRNPTLYHDGIIIGKDGLSNGKMETKTDTKKLNQLKKQIKVYAHEFVDALFEGKVKAPSNGDCWGCLFKSEDGNKAPFGTDHYLQHFEEKYFVPSLLVSAVKRYANGPAYIQTAYAYMEQKLEYAFAKERHNFIFTQIETAIYKWIKAGFKIA